MCSAHIVLLLTFILNDLTMYLAFLGQWDMLWTGAVHCLAFYIVLHFAQFGTFYGLALCMMLE